MKVKKKETRGGRREGSGAKLKYGEKTTTISFRVPISLAEKFKRKFKSILNAKNLQRL